MNYSNSHSMILKSIENVLVEIKTCQSNHYVMIVYNTIDALAVSWSVTQGQRLYLAPSPITTPESPNSGDIASGRERVCVRARAYVHVHVCVHVCVCMHTR